MSSIRLALLTLGVCSACSSLASGPSRAPHPDGEEPSTVAQEEQGGVKVFGPPITFNNQPGVTPVEIDTVEPAAKSGADESEQAEQKKAEFFVAPIPFLDSQIGLGLAVTGGYIFPLDDDPATPPSTVALGGFYSENDSKGAFGMARLHLPGDAWRLLVGGGAFHINYDFFGIGNGAGDNDASLPFETDYSGVKLQALRRFSESVYFGPSLQSLKASTRIANGALLPPGLIPAVFDTQNTALGLEFEFDTRDNQFSPTAGEQLTVKTDFYDEKLGSDFDFNVLDTQLAAYPALDDKTVLAWRVRGKYVGDDAPFFALAQYDTRGYQKGRYRDQLMLGAELEYRRELRGRFGGVAFAGLGQVAPDLSDLDGDNLLPSAGVGLRIRLTEENPLYYGIDVAVGKNETILYFKLGQAF
jgi:hypothetical protein